MDNYSVDIVSDSRLKDILSLTFNRRTATHFSKESKSLTFYWSDPSSGRLENDDGFTFGDNVNPKFIELPVKLGPEEADSIVRKWLMESAEYSSDTISNDQGSCKKGFRVRTSPSVACNLYTLAIIEPIWAIYHK